MEPGFRSGDRLTDGLVLLHAWPLDARQWDPQVGRFGDRVRTIAPDLPGFGGSEPAGEVMTMGAAADRVLGAMDGAGIDRAVVCGCSMGGYVTFELWRRARERVGGLVLADTRAVADTAEGAEARRALARRLLAEGSGFLVEDPPPLLSEHSGEQLRERVGRIIAEQPPEAIAAAALGMADRPDSTPDLAAIDVPTLVIAGAEDALIPPAVSVSMGRSIPGAVIEVIPEAGHLPSLERPEELDLAVSAHLVRCGLVER